MKAGADANGERCYAYVSDAKLEFLINQIPTELLSRLTAEIESLPTGWLDSGRYQRLHITQRYMSRHGNVSGLFPPATWFHGAMELRSTIYGDAKSGLVLSTGEWGNAIFALIGPAHHLSGGFAPPRSPSDPGPGSRLPALFSQLRHDQAEWHAYHRGHIPRRPIVVRYDDDQRSLQEVVTAHTTMPGLTEPREFLAHRLMVGSTWGPDGRLVHVVIGTPLYVAVAVLTPSPPRSDR